MPDADLQRILADLRRRREELAKVLFHSESPAQPAVEGTTGDASDSEVALRVRSTPGNDPPS